MKKITTWLERAPQTAFALYCLFFSFSTYLCVLAFRKPFTSGSFAGAYDIFGLGKIDYKVLLVISQVLGYAFSKFLGIKFVSEASKKNRAWFITGMILLAEASFVIFPLIPAPYNAFCLFFNGIPLGMIWGLVFSYLEGRRLSDLLGPGLSGSFIVGSGIVKSAGNIVLDWGVPEMWMPALTGALFLPFTLFCVKMLDLIPPPTAAEEAMRTKRVPMDALERKKFLLTFAPGLVLLTVLYVVLSAYKDFRDSFAREIWEGLGYAGDYSIFTVSETPIALVVLLALGAMVLLKDNRRSFNTIFSIMTAGMALVGISTLASESGLISPKMWMMVMGSGLYLAYVPFGCMLYDNLIGMTHFVGTAGMMIYVSDAFGYLGSVGVMLYKNLGHGQMDWVDFFIKFSYFTSISCTLCFVVSYFYFVGHKSIPKTPVMEAYGNA